MANSIVKTAIAVGLNAEEAIGGLNKFSKHIDGVSKKIGNSLISNLKSIPIAGVFVGLAASVQKLSFGIFDRFLEATDNLAQQNKISKALGISTDSFQSLAYAARLSGVDIDTLATSIKFFEKSIVQGVTTETDPFKKLGLSARELAKLPVDEALLKTVDAFGQLKGAADKTFTALDIFGKGGAGFLPFLNKGQEGIKNLMNDAKRMGVIVSPEDIARVGQARLAVKQLKESGDAFYTQFAVAFAPFIQSLAETLPNVFQELLEVMPHVKTAIQEVTLALLDAGIALANLKFSSLLPSANTAKTIGGNAALAGLNLPAALYHWYQQIDDKDDKTPSKLAESLQKIRDKIANVNVPEANNNAAADAATADADKLNDAVAKLSDSIRDNTANIGLNSFAIQINNLKKAQASAEAIAYLENLNKENELAKKAAELKNLKVENPFEDYKKTVSDLDAAFKKGYLSQDQFALGIFNATKKLKDLKKESLTFELPSLAVGGSAEASNLILEIQNRKGPEPIMTIAEKIEEQKKLIEEDVQTGKDQLAELRLIKEKLGIEGDF